MGFRDSSWNISLPCLVTLLYRVLGDIVRKTDRETNGGKKNLTLRLPYRCDIKGRVFHRKLIFH